MSGCSAAILIALVSFGRAAFAAQMPSSQIVQGARLFQYWCEDCHAAGERPGTVALQRRYGGSVPAALEERTDLNDALVSFVVRNGKSFMPFFRETEISDEELVALDRYLSSNTNSKAAARRAAAGPSPIRDKGIIGRSR